MDEIKDQAAFINTMFPNGFPEEHPFYEPPRDPKDPPLESHRMIFIDLSNID